MDNEAFVVFAIICFSILLPMAYMAYDISQINKNTTRRVRIVTCRKIAGRFNDYFCDIADHGYSDVVVKVYRTDVHESLFGYIKKQMLTMVWESKPRDRPAIRIAKPDQLMAWYQIVVDEYEEYLFAWTNDVQGSVSAWEDDEVMDQDMKVAMAPLLST